MSGLIRVALAAVAGLATLFFVFWVGWALMPDGTPEWLALVVSVAAAVLVARFIWARSGGATGLLSSMAVGGLATGAIGFCGGFFGPMVLAPDANQGPLLGLFITGPLGVVIGAVGGAVYWLAARPRAGGSGDVP